MKLPLFFSFLIGCGIGHAVTRIWYTEYKYAPTVPTHIRVPKDCGMPGNDSRIIDMYDDYSGDGYPGDDSGAFCVERGGYVSVQELSSYMEARCLKLRYSDHCLDQTD
jgi:hypothetical protein